MKTMFNVGFVIQCSYLIVIKFNSTVLCTSFSILINRVRILWRRHVLFQYQPVKDARSVFLYPYNQSQICQYVKNTK